MIADYNEYSDEDEPLGQPNLYVNAEDDRPPTGTKNIRWIIQ